MNALSGKGVARGGHPPQERAVITAPPQKKRTPESVLDDFPSHRGGDSERFRLKVDLFFGLYLVIQRRMDMKPSSQIKPISYLKAHAAEIVRNMSGQGEPLVITQNGEAKVVMLDVESYEQTQEAMALLKILALGSRQIEEGKVRPAGDVIRRLRDRSKSR